MQKKESAREIAAALYTEEKIIAENSDAARELHNQSSYGTLLEDGRIELSLLEALYLVEKKRLRLIDTKRKEIDVARLVKKTKKHEKNFWTKYTVFKDIRNRGYIIKTALKFGADFRVYDRGIKPGQDHAKWILFPIHESSSLTWHDFASKNRVAHSTKKNLLLAIVDEENDVSYYEVQWVKP